jgi:tetratricopeptide (TPR) repeat protein
MTSRPRLGCTLIAALALLGTLLHGHCAAAQEDTATTVEAGRHFRHGVELYSEADYAGALVEFKRAYALAPSSAALYDVGEAQFQLQDYASALKTFRRFLAEFGPNEAHRAEIERDVEVLRARVGRVNVGTVPSGADISVDDQPVGKTPIGEPVLVSVGHRRLVASMPGRSAVTRYLDVAAGDELSVTLTLPAPVDAIPAVSAGPQSPSPGSAGQPLSVSTLRTIGWIATGTLAAGAITFGVLAVHETGDLKNARNTFPGSSATLNHDANLALTYSVIADSLTAAAVIAGGLSLYWTLSSPASDRPKRGRLPASRVALGPASARFEMTF